MEKFQMGLRKNLARVGTSYSVIIDRTMMKLLSIQPDTELDLAIKDGSLIITPVNKEAERKAELDKVLNESFEQFDSAYKKLAQ